MKKLIGIIAILLSSQAWGWTNLALESKSFGNATNWTKARVTIDNDSLVSPDGNTTAEKLVSDSTATNNHGVFQVLSDALFTDNTTITFSCYLKKGSGTFSTWANLRIVNILATEYNVYVNLDDNTIGTVTAGAAATMLNTGINGWYRVSLSAPVGYGSPDPSFSIFLAEADNDRTFSGDGASYTGIFGAQVEQGDMASSYIPTTTAAVERTDINPDYYFAAGNGSTDDTIPVQSCLTFASDNGSTCDIPASKNYLITAPIYIWGDSNLVGVDNTSIITFNADNSYLLNVGISGIHVPEDAFTGNISNINFTMAGGSGGRMIFFWRADGASITNNYFDLGNYTYSATSSGNNANILTDVEGYIRNDLTISGNTIQAVTDNGGSEGFGLGNFTYVVIDNNNISGVGDDPIAVHECDNVVITNNTVTSVDGRVAAFGSQNVEIANNDIQRVIGGYDNTWRSGIALLYVYIEQEYQPAPDNVYIHTNTLTYPSDSIDSGAAIYVYAPRNTRVENNTIINNSINSYVGHPSGIYLLPQTTGWGTGDLWEDPDGIDPDNTARVHQINIEGNVMTEGFPLIVKATGSCDDYVGPVTIDNNYALNFTNIVACDNIALSGNTTTSPTYYVDQTGGDDGAAGTGPGTAWQTISKVNAATFSAGDYVLFKKGETWREQLTVPSSGSAGNPITFGAYGSGALPIITGADLITPGTSWAADATPPSNYGDTSFSSTTGTNYGGYIYTWPISVTTGGTVTSYVINLSGVPAGANGKMYVYTDNGSGAPNALVANSAVGGQALDNGTNTFTPSTPPTVSDSTTYHLALHTDQDVSTRVAGASGGNYYWKARAYASGPLDPITAPTDAGAADDTDRYIVVNTGAEGAENVWVATGISSEPFTLAINGTWNNQKKASKVAVAADNDWWWDAGSIYLYSTSDPDTRFTSPGVEYGVRDAAIDVTKENIVISYVQALMGNVAGVYGSTANTTTTDNVTIHYSTISGLYGIMLYGSDTWGWNNVYIDNNAITPANYLRTMNAGPAGVRLNAGGTFNNIQITNNTFTGAGEDGIAAAESTNSDLIITGNTFASNGENCIDIKGTTGATVSNNHCVNDGEANIVVHISSSNVTIDNNIFSGCGTITGANDCIQFGKTGHSVPGGIIRYNLVENAGRSAIAVTDSDNTLVYYNVVNGWAVSANGGGIKVLNSENVEVYNNTVYGVADGYRGIQFVLGSPGGIAKNNIVRMTGVVGLIEVDSTSVTSFVANNNLYYGESSSWGWNDTFGSFADWKTGSGQDAQAINADPLFVSASDFHLQSSSPAINAGVSVGLTQDYDGYTVPRGAAPDIGAYEWADTVLPLSPATTVRIGLFPFTFLWEGFASPDGTPLLYQIQIDDANDFATPMVDTTTTSTSYEWDGSGAAPGETYYWRVRALH